MNHKSYTHDVFGTPELWPFPLPLIYVGEGYQIRERETVFILRWGASRDCGRPQSIAISLESYQVEPGEMPQHIKDQLPTILANLKLAYEYGQQKV